MASMVRPTNSYTYTANHKRVRRHRGAAKLFDCEICAVRKAHHWSLTHDSDPTAPNSYRALCASCHMQYDEVGGHHNPNKLTTELVQEIRRRREDGEGATHLAREFGVNPHTIHDVVSRRIWTHV